MEQRMLKPELKQQPDTDPAIYAHAVVYHSDQWDRGSTGTTPPPVLGTWGSATHAATSGPERKSEHAKQTADARSSA
jgi:hypothetical protein